MSQPDTDEMIQRKEDHIDLVLAERSGLRQQKNADANAFDAIRLRHCALPELDFDSVDMRTAFLSFHLRRPFLISSMTGGPTRAEAINQRLAEAASELGIAMGVGSQRVAIEATADAGLAKSIRATAKGVPLFSNLGAAQLRSSLDAAFRAVETLEADALILHFNPAQEILQPGGDRHWSGILEAVARLCQDLPVPVIAKEVGFGLSGEVAEKLVTVGVKAVDVAGRGGTNFGRVERSRNTDPEAQALGHLLDDWGLDTVTCLREIKAKELRVPLIASGGIRHGLDAAKSLALGATLIAQAGAILEPALRSTEAVIKHFQTLEETLRTVCFLTGSGRVHQLSRALMH